jgi:tripartite ATP-independent transporter DctP family solute receptor
MALGGTFLSGCGSSKKSGAKVVARLSHDLSENDPYNKGAVKFAELAKQYTNGHVEIRIFPNHTLASEPEGINMMRTGALSMALIGGNLPTVDPRWLFGALPYLFTSYAQADKVFESEVGKQLLDMLPDNGMVGLSFFVNDFRDVTNSVRPINVPSDLAGMKIRVPQNKAWIATFEALGARPTPTDFGQLYLALKTKVVDGQEGAPSVVLTSKFYETQTYLSVTQHIFMPVPLIVSKKFWDTLDSETQKALRRAAVEAAQYQRALVRDEGAQDIQKLQSMGMKVNTVDRQPFIDATRGVYDQLSGQVPGLADIVKKIRSVTA